MKAKYLFIGLLILSATGCKKCWTCHNECYQCKHLQNGTFCSSDFPSVTTYNGIKGDILKNDTCWLITSTQQEDICDRSAKLLLENQVYFCDEKK